MQKRGADGFMLLFQPYLGKLRRIRKTTPRKTEAYQETIFMVKTRIYRILPHISSGIPFLLDHCVKGLG
jgi:hypothetical protein